MEFSRVVRRVATATALSVGLLACFEGVSSAPDEAAHPELDAISTWDGTTRRTFTTDGAYDVTMRCVGTDLVGESNIANSEFTAPNSPRCEDHVLTRGDFAE